MIKFSWKKERKENPIFTIKLFIVLSFVNDIKACPNGVLYVQYQSIIEVFWRMLTINMQKQFWIKA